MWSKAQLGGRRMRLIDADKLIKDINDYFKNEVGKIHKNVQQEVLFLVCDTILDHNSGVLKVIESQPVSKVNEWIPVSERLPSSDGRFEVTIKGSKGKRYTEMCNFHKDATIYKWGGKWSKANVIAWKERSQPYKEETK